MIIIRKERYITVIDDWYPCYEGNKIKLILSLNSFKDNYYVKFAAWGADDTAYEVEFDYDNYEDANEKYNFLIPIFEIIPDGINKEWFINHGFTRF